MAPPQPPSLDLPKPPTDLRAVRKGKTVILTWTVPDKTTDKQRIQSATTQGSKAQIGATQICRGGEVPLTQCGTPVGQAVPLKANRSSAESPDAKFSEGKSSKKKPFGSKSDEDKITTSYTDSLPVALLSDNPSAVATYAVEVLNADGRGAGLSNQVRVPVIRALPPPSNIEAKVTKEGVVLSWQNQLAPASSDSTSSSESVRYIYRVFRRQEGSEHESLVGDVPPSAHTLTDSTFEWEKTYFYRIETVTVITRPDKTELQIEGADSAEIKVFADDVFPPAVPAGLQAVFSGPGQQAFIDLVWAPVTDLDLNGYNVYRREEGSAWMRMNPELVKTPAYRDTNVSAGKNYMYTVSAVDVHGNESARSDEASERVP
jgi:antitoxin (DNA-binding transcriptional repressor) of toxin-antitoxin stability system